MEANSERLRDIASDVINKRLEEEFKKNGGVMADDLTWADIKTFLYRIASMSFDSKKYKLKIYGRGRDPGERLVLEPIFEDV